MRVGAVLRNSGPDGVDAVRRIADLAEELGYDAVWASDHVLTPPDFAGRYGEGFLDPFVSLAVAAERAPSVDLGMSVLVVPYRAPLPAARAIATLQEISGGRLTVGVGSGWLESEFTALGEDFAARGAVTDERIAVIRTALSGGDPAFGAPTSAVPFLAAGNSRQNLARAARLDGWHPIGRPPTFVAARTALLPAGHRVALRTRLGLGHERKGRPLFGPPDEIVADVADYTEAGVTDLVVDYATDSLVEVESYLREFAKLIGDVRG